MKINSLQQKQKPCAFLTTKAVLFPNLWSTTETVEVQVPRPVIHK